MLLRWPQFPTLDSWNLQVYIRRTGILACGLIFGIMDAMNCHPNRRAFVSGSIAALAASSVRAAPEQREIRTAFIGIGHRGTVLTGQVRVAV
jgi:hypothetical protein